MYFRNINENNKEIFRELKIVQLAAFGTTLQEIEHVHLNPKIDDTFINSAVQYLVNFYENNYPTRDVDIQKRDPVETFIGFKDWYWRSKQSPPHPTARELLLSVINNQVDELREPNVNAATLDNLIRLLLTYLINLFKKEFPFYMAFFEYNVMLLINNNYIVEDGIKVKLAYQWQIKSDIEIHEITNSDIVSKNKNIDVVEKNGFKESANTEEYRHLVALQNVYDTQIQYQKQLVLECDNKFKELKELKELKKQEMLEHEQRMEETKKLCEQDIQNQVTLYQQQMKQQTQPQAYQQQQQYQQREHLSALKLLLNPPPPTPMDEE